MWVFWLTVSFVVGVPSLVALGFYVFDPPYSVTEKRKDRRAARVYEKGMILRKMSEDPFENTRYRYVAGVMENESGITYLKTVECNENGDCDEKNIKSFKSDTASWYLENGWNVYSKKN